MVKKLRLLHMVTLYNTYTRYTHAHYQEFIAVKFLRGLVVIAISQLLDLRQKSSPVTVIILALLNGISLIVQLCIVSPHCEDYAVIPCLSFKMCKNMVI